MEDVMRAHEFPLQLFQIIHSAIGEPALEKWSGSRKWQYFRIKQGEHTVAHLGYEKDSWSGSTYAKVALWGAAIREPMTDENEWEAKHPCLEVTGGPHQTGHWSAGSGKLLREGVSLHLSGDIGDISSPFVSVLGQVLMLANQLANEIQPASLTYWQAFKSPGQSFDRPE
jgi:hypothetical protein